MSRACAHACRTVGAKKRSLPLGTLGLRTAARALQTLQLGSTATRAFGCPPERTARFPACECQCATVYQVSTPDCC